MGYSPYYIYILFKKYAKEITEFDSGTIISGVGNLMINKKINISGLKTGESLEKAYNMLAKKRGITKISDIKRMPLVIPAVDIIESKEYVFTNHVPEIGENSPCYMTDISVGKAIRASSSFPAIFSPCYFKEHIFLDGGALDNVPVIEVKKQNVDKVIAVNFKADDIDENSNMMDIAMRTIDVMGNKISEESLQQSDYVLTVATDKTGLLDVEKLDNCYKFGYQAVTQNLKEIKGIFY